MARGNGRAGRWWVHAPDLHEPGADGRLQAIALTRAGVLTAGAALLALAGVLANLLENRRATNLTHARELYTEAVGQLGSDTLDVRLGTIYALERIATDYTADHRTVVEVLSAFVREHTIPGRPGAARRSRPAAALPTPADRAAGAPAGAPAGLDTDIQAALTVLGRLPARIGVSRADLTGAHLAGAQLPWANLAEARLYETNLTRANLNGTNLTDAGLDGANLTDARLGGANLTDAQGLTQEQLDGASGDGRTVLPDHLARPASWPGPDAG